MSKFLPSALFAAATLLPAAALAAFPGHPMTSIAISAADLSARDKALADDAFEGRGPGTANGEAAAQWIADELKRIGVAPANNGSYFQSVPAVSITLDRAHSHLTFQTAKGSLAPKIAEDVTFWTPRFAAPEVKVTGLPLVFVGYGVVAPEYHWDDYAGMDVKGKAVVILINDPGNEDAHPDPKFFKGRAMTYYGRWTYKYEEAARQGAAAVIIVHETKPAAYGWPVVRDSWGAANMSLEAADQGKSLSAIQGWITHETAIDLFHRAGLDYYKLKAAANRPGFKAVAMTGESLSATAHSSITHVKTRNVLGIIPGTRNPGDVFIYSAHWDHLGRKDNAPGADKIFNGAVDNAMGCSQVMELAEKWAHEKRPQRSIIFAFWTMEEQGLLGSQYFAEHPLWPRNHIVGVINLDGAGPQPRARNLVASGTGQSEMEDVLKDALVTQKRVLSPDPEPEKGGFFRSDHFSLARRGIPAISPDGGDDLLVGGKAAGKKLSDDYLEHRYHQPSDEWRSHWDLSGPAEDAEIYFLAGNALANSDRWPNYLKDSEFRALRDKDMAAKK
ncbi:MAG: M28 family peptidase [Alphaproteobacteria bacterium]|nr:M28 family peptidase [Alphaproteobacteria bacterium]